MAIILGSKKVKDLPENDRVAIGITLPMQKGETGYFEQSFQTAEQIKSNLRNLMLTVPGERVMHPRFGTRLWRLLFDNNTDVFEADVESAIQDAIRDWMPFIEIQQIDIVKDNSTIDANQYQVTMNYRISNQPTLDTVTFNITE